MSERPFHVRLAAPVRRVVLADPTRPPVVLPVAPANAEPKVPVEKPPPQPSTEALADLRDRLLAAVADFRRQQQRVERERLTEWQRAAVELAATLATKLLHERITTDAFAVEELVRDMIGQLANSQPPVTVHLHPADLALLKQRLGEDSLLPEGTAEPRLVPNSALGRGNCRVEAGEQTLHADLVDQLAEVRAQLLRSLGHARA